MQLPKGSRSTGSDRDGAVNVVNGSPEETEACTAVRLPGDLDLVIAVTFGEQVPCHSDVLLRLSYRDRTS